MSPLRASPVASQKYKPLLTAHRPQSVNPHKLNMRSLEFCTDVRIGQQWLRGAGVAKRSYPTSKGRGGGREELPQDRGQGWRLGGATPRPKSGGCMGAGGPRGATPCSRSGGVAVRRYTSSKVSSCALLKQL